MNFFFGTSILASYSFKLFRDVSFSVNKCLLSNPFGRHFVLVRISHLNIVTKNVIKGYFNEVIPVRSDSLASIPSKNSLPKVKS
jgi:hypothetical protein